MAKKKNKHLPITVKLIIIIVAVVLVAAAIALWHERSVQLATFDFVHSKITELEGLQAENQLAAVNTQSLNEDAARTQKQIEDFDLITSHKSLEQLKTETTIDQENLEEAIYVKHEQEAAQAALNAKRSAALAGSKVINKSTAGEVVLPIIMYHKPPADFDAQMAALKAKGYTTVHMSDVANFFAGKAKLPAKPAVVTFDDGFEVQLSALPTLQRNGQKATLYLIEGGAMSHYCIGLLRTNVTCGDAYLSVTEVKNMMSSGLIEIGDHTVDHPNMASLSEADQQFQITTNKAFLEQTFGVPITTFAYPYGNYNGTTVRLLSQDGFSTAVTTQPGIVQSASEPLLLHRTRTTLNLP